MVFGVGALQRRCVAVSLLIVTTRAVLPIESSQGCVGYTNVSSCSRQPLPHSDCTRHILTNASTTHGAGCLDGSAPGFYFRPGIGVDAKNFIVWSHGGGWCRTEGECADRAMTYEGSSKCNNENGPPRANMKSGIMDTNCAVNPKFCNWSVAYMMYCDGGSWVGDRDEPAPTSQAEYTNPPIANVYFRGRRNLRAIVDSLLQPSFGIASASKVLFMGASAGGLTAYLHCDSVAAMLAQGGSSASVHCLGDAGFFIDHPNIAGHHVWRDQMRHVYTMMNASGSVNAECVAGKPADLQWMCMFADYALPHIRSPFFVSNSNFDSWAMEGILGVDAYYQLKKPDLDAFTKCSTDYHDCTAPWKATIDNWGTAFRGKLLPVLATPHHGAFVNNCHRHHNIDGNEAFSTKINGSSLVESVATWINGDGPKLLDSLVPGSNPTCTGDEAVFQI